MHRVHASVQVLCKHLYFTLASHVTPVRTAIKSTWGACGDGQCMSSERVAASAARTDDRAVCAGLPEAG